MESGLVMYRRITIVFCAMLLVLSGCVPGLSKDDNTKKIIQQDKKGKKEKKVEITPKLKTDDEQYRTVVNFSPGPARGYVLNGVDNRLDVDELETGLMRLSKPAFSPDKYVFQEGQYLSSDTLDQWLGHKNMNKEEGKPVNPDGLNPQVPKGWDDFSWQKKDDFLQDHPSYLSAIVEQNYLVQEGKDKLKLGGVSLAIAVNKIFSYRIEDSEGLQHDGQVELNPKTAKAVAKKDAEIILQRVRKIDGLKNVPIVMALYQEQDENSLVPGHFFAKTEVGGGDTQIDGWKKVKESHYLFPSDQASEDHKDDADMFDKFTKDIQDYFPNYVGVIGKGFYENDELRRLTVDIPIKFYDQTEVMSFAQYIASLISDKNDPFSKDVPIEVSVSSTEGPKALIVRKPDMDEPFVHIYH
jgi:protein involved in sex pheromone biosynthesis